MADTSDKDLDEKLSPWAVKLEAQDTEHDRRDSTTARAELNEKLSQWGVALQDQEIENIEEGARQSSPVPAGGHRNVSPRRASPVEMKVVEEGQGDSQLNEKLSPWGVEVGDQAGEEDSSELALKEKLTKRGTSVEFEYVGTRKGLQSKLVEWGIDTQTVEHPEVFTVEQALPHLSNVEGMFAKNLFLGDKRRNLYLFCAPHDANITLNDLARTVGASGGLRLAGPGLLDEKLGLKQGAVTVFGLVNDQFHDVQLILDRRLIDGTYSKILFHPMVNSATSAISPTGLKKFLEHTGHEPVLIDIPV